MMMMMMMTMGIGLRTMGGGGVNGTVGVAGQQRLPGLVSILQHWHRLQHVAPKMICDQLQLFVAASGSHF